MRWKGWEGVGRGGRGNEGVGRGRKGWEGEIMGWEKIGMGRNG